MRKATFIKTDTGTYQPVNKRAKALTNGKTVVKRAVKRLASKNLGVYVWTNAGLRKVA